MTELASLVLPAPAKINRLLHVVGRREDGYHLLQTVFQFLDLADRITLSRRDDGVIWRERGLAGLPPEQDLVVRAALALRTYCGRPELGASIAVDKVLPHGGGLGGGSSDAATVLLGLNRLWALGLGEDVLAQIGLGLGADVPVFVRGFAAWAEGVGERLQPIKLDQPWVVLVAPGVEVPTAQIFQDGRLTRDTPLMTMRGFLAWASAGFSAADGCPGMVVNDLQSLVVQRFPEIGEVLAWLSERACLNEHGGTVQPVMSGSGSCVFMVVNSAREAEQIVSSLPDRWRGFVAKTMNRSSLHRVLFEADS